MTPAKDVGLVQNYTPGDSNTLQRIVQLAQRNANEIIAGKAAFKSRLEALFQHGRLLEYAIGTVAHVTTSSDTKHTFSEADTLSSFTLEDAVNSTADVGLSFAGCKIDGLAISLDLDGVLTANADIVSKTVATATSVQTAVISALVALPSFYASLKTGADGTEATLTNVQKFNVSIRNNLESIYGYGSRLLTDLQATERHYEFDFTAAFTSKTEYDLFLGQAGSPTGTATPTIPSVIFNANNAVALGSGRREFNIDFSNAYYESTSKPSVVKGFIMQDFKGWAKAITSSECYSVDNISSVNW